MILMASSTVYGSTGDIFWPPPPDKGRLQYIGEIDCTQLEAKSGFLGKIKKLFAGKDESEEVSLPFDIVTENEYIYLTCQNIPALIKINRSNNNFKYISNKEYPLVYPISLCKGDKGEIYITDVEQKAVFKFQDDEIKPFITTGLNRPTGIASIFGKNRLYVVDTGDHSLKIYDLNGNFLKKVPGDNNEPIFYYPTFITKDGDNILINDALNYSIKRFDVDGNFISSFGMEGNGPGTFSRPKGLAIDSDEHIYVVDNLVDNFQIFDKEGKLLLVVGSRGHLEGQFWSPAGIDIKNDTLFIADTFNNRIQILLYLGEDK